MSHTPTPWRVKTNAEYIDLDEGEGLVVYGIVGPSPQEKSIVVTDSGYYGPNIEDAQFIVKAVNSHQAMKEALEAIVARIDGVYDNPSLIKQGLLSERMSIDVLCYAKKALTLAKGKDKEP